MMNPEDSNTENLHEEFRKLVRDTAKLDLQVGEDDMIFQELRIDEYAAEVTDQELAEFACGFGNPEDEERILDAMLESNHIRERVMDHRACAKVFGTQPLSSLAPKTPGEEIVAKVLLDRAEAILGFCVQSTPDDTRSKWKVAFDAFSQSAKGLLGLPRFAMQRGREDELFAVAPGVTANIEIVENETGLEARVELSGDLASIHGKEMTLLLEDPVSGSIPLALTLVDGNAWTVALGRLNFDRSVRLGLSIDTKRSRPDKSTTVATISNTSRVVPISYCGIPEIRDGHLNIEVEIAAPVRSEFSNSRLCLSLHLGGLSQQLGCWSIKEWSSDPKNLVIPVPSPADGEFQCSSLLRAHIL